MYLFKTEGGAEEEAFSEDEYGELSNLSNMISVERINYLISLLDKTQQDIQFSKIRRILIEVALIKAGMPSEKERIADLSHKIDIYMDQLNSYEQWEQILSNSNKAVLIPQAFEVKIVIT